METKIDERERLYALAAEVVGDEVALEIPVLGGTVRIDRPPVGPDGYKITYSPCGRFHPDGACMLAVAKVMGGTRYVLAGKFHAGYTVKTVLALIIGKLELALAKTLWDGLFHYDPYTRG